jgi:hypothetical protein
MSAIAFNDDKNLAYTQGVRRRIIDHLTSGENLPDDPKLLNVVLSALKDDDKVTLTLKRIQADSEIADADRQALAQVHRISQQLGSRDLARTDTPIDSGQRGPSTPFNPDEIPRSDVADGELHQGGDPVDYDHFMQEQTVLHQQKLDNQK